MTDAAAIAAGAPGRYATALFELAAEQDALEAVEADLAQLRDALAESEDLRAAISSPVYARDQQARAMAALAGRMELGRLSRNLLGLMAAKGRLYTLPAVIEAYAALMAEHRGEITAEVETATALSEAQTAALKEKIKAAVGRDVALNVTVDEALLGGLVVKVGSKMIDSSIRSRLANLQTVLKEVG